jgi:hypothetical protein
MRNDDGDAPKLEKPDPRAESGLQMQPSLRMSPVEVPEDLVRPAGL